jgi:hypothetical protein
MFLIGSSVLTEASPWYQMSYPMVAPMVVIDLTIPWLI